MKGELFVVRRGRGNIIDVYSTTSYELIRTFDVSEYLSEVWSSGCPLTSCDTNRCLYVSHWDQQTVYKIDSRGNKLMRWQVDGWPRGLSVSRSTNIIVTCDAAICEYTPSGSLVNRVSLLPSEVSDAIHTVQLSSGEYVVSQLEPVHGVSVLNREGRVVFTYRNEPQSDTRLLNYPWQLAVTDNDHIIVADSYNNRIITLNSTLSCVRDLSLLLDYEVIDPESVYFAESCSQLYVGEGNGRVLIFEGITDFS
jgi:DNA-binding beta-propeller fold protein YncE